MKDLREMRVLSGLTQFSLSRRSGVSRMRVSLAECGEVELASEEANEVHKVLLAAIKAKHAKTAIVLATLSTCK